MNSKIETYIGFAIKKGSVVFGCDSIKSYKKKMYLLLATRSLSENSLQLLRVLSQKSACRLLQIEDYPALAQKNCKALAICDKSLAEAITNVWLGGNNG